MISDEDATELVKRFVKEACVIDPTDAEIQIRLYEDFRYWAIRKAGIKISYPFCIGKNTFSKILMELGFEKRTGRPQKGDYYHVYFYGLRSLFSDRL